MKNRVGLNLWQSWTLLMMFVAMLLSGIAPNSEAQVSRINFNHNTTGFPLVGAHAREQCDTCHSKGVFRGTPKQCSACHVKGSGTAATHKPDNHIPTQAACDTCHGAYAWSPARFTHMSVMVGSCATCHNGAFVSQGAFGKSYTHSKTDAPCDTCHKSTKSWNSGVRHAHDPLNDIGRCAACHNGKAAHGKNAAHIPTSAQCSTCHTNFTTFSPAVMDHTGLTACSSCHNGSFTAANAQAKTPTHPEPAPGQCSTCHSSTTSWATAIFNHSGIGSQACSSCHDGSGVSGHGLGKPTNHIPTTAACDNCHNKNGSFASFLPAFMDHTGASACSTCHNGSFKHANAQTKGAAHIPTSMQCDTCHENTVSFAPARMDHTGLAGQCNTCHGTPLYLSSNAQTKTVTHVATSAQCDSCHKGTTSWATATFDHNSVSGGAAGKCDTCHRSGGTGLAKPAAHIPTAAQCDTCHKNFSTFAPATMDHTGMVGQCLTCHAGSYTFANAKAKPTSHIPTNLVANQQCDVCHKSYTAFAPAVMDHSGLAGKCATCHGGAYITSNAQAKTATHVSTNAQCDTCHKSNTTWATVTFTHDPGTATNNCSSCHNGAQALGKPTNHIPMASVTNTQCDACHNNFTAFAPITAMDHTGSGGKCSNCHNGAYLFANALAKTVKHTPTSAQCDSCHTSGTTASYTKWTGATYTHTAVIGGGTCATCHGLTALGKPSTHIPTTRACDQCHGNFTAFAPATMSHTGETACSTCHNGSYLAANAQAKSATHVATVAQCSQCHRGTTTWATTTVNHSSFTPSVSGRCSSCHDGSTVSGHGLGKPTNHIPTTAQCDVCHSNSNFTAFAQNVTMGSTGHGSTTGPAATGNCSTCHNSSYLFAGLLAKPTNHVVTSAQCDSCHTSTSGYTVWTGAAYAHPANAPGQCSTCHFSGGSGLAKLATHIPTALQCDLCHTSYSVFTAGTTMNHTGTNGNCLSCHNGSFLTVGTTGAKAKAVSHIPTTKQCDTCHTSFTAPNGFATWTMNHTGTTSACLSCHTGTYPPADGKNVGHVVTNAQCDTCHTNTSNYTSWLGATYTHRPTDTVCSSCHVTGGAGRAKPATHIPTGAQCSACHGNYVSFAPAVMSHTNTSTPSAANNCSTCHGGAYVAVNAQAKSATHAATTAQCDTCHFSTTTWATVTFNHASVTGGAAGKCSTCHDGSGASGHGLGKPSTHIPTTGQCDTCHTNYVAFNPATMNHTTGSSACSTCHNGSYTTQGTTGALAKKSTHIPTTGQCSVCHKNYVAFNPATMDHTGTTNTCSNCHNGTYTAANAQAKSGAHVATTSQCDVCHKSTTTWLGAVYTHAATDIGKCASCHNGTTALGKDANHVPTTQWPSCDNCHVITGGVTGKTGTQLAGKFKGAKVHGTSTTPAVAKGTCTQCHEYLNPYGLEGRKPSEHTTTARKAPNSCDNSGCHSVRGF